jgi:fructokinase
VIVVCGEALIDLVPEGAAGAFRAHPGGSPANVAVGLGRLGTRVEMVARLAADGFGRLLREHLATSAVGLGRVTPAAEPTTLAVVALDRAGQAEYSFYVDGCADGGWSTRDLPADLPAEVVAVHVSGSLALAVPSMGDTLEALLRRERGRRTLVLDPNVRPALAADEGMLRARLDRWLGLVDLVKVSSDDAGWLAPGEPPPQLARRWLAAGPRLVVITRGGAGVYAANAAGEVDLPAEPITVVDTVGAGDAFTAGLLDALARAGRLAVDALPGLTPEALRDALRAAQRVAAITCGRAGADPPRREELT